METKVCKGCKQMFTVTAQTKRKVFCNSSCAATYNNVSRITSDESKINISNGLKNYYKENPDKIKKGNSHSEIVGKATKGKFNKNVSGVYELSGRTIQKILKRLGLCCSNCGWDKTTCDIHHINGRKIENPHDHKNLTLLCPNCHRLVHEGKLKKDSLVTLETYLPDNWKDVYYG